MTPGLAYCESSGDKAAVRKFVNSMRSTAVNVFEISELELSAELLPQREALGGFNVNDYLAVVAAENNATAVGIGGDAEANADQDIDLGQG